LIEKSLLSEDYFNTIRTFCLENYGLSRYCSPDIPEIKVETIIFDNTFTITGSDFKVNADIKDSGFMRMAVLNESGEAIAGYT
jgi:hypothetical protein